MNDIIDRIHWLGHSAFRVDGTKTIYIDPYKIKGGPPADIILVTHTHYDHFSPDDISKVATNNTTLIISADAEPRFPGEVIKVKPGDRIETKDVVVEAKASYNKEKQFHPRANDWVGYILTMDGAKVYHAGDTDFIPEMEGIKADVVLVPVGGTFTMDPIEAAQAVMSMNVRVAIPMHWGEVAGSVEDARKFKELVGDYADVIIPEKGA